MEGKGRKRRRALPTTTARLYCTDLGTAGFCGKFSHRTGALLFVLPPPPPSPAHIQHVIPGGKSGGIKPDSVCSNSNLLVNNTG